MLFLQVYSFLQLHSFLQVESIPELSPPLPNNASGAWWEQVLIYVLGIVAAAFVKYLVDVFGKRGNSQEALVNEIRKLQKKGAISAAQAEKKIELILGISQEKHEGVQHETESTTT